MFKKPLFKRILIALVIIIIVFFVVVEMQPAEFRIYRTAIISAPASAVFAQVNDFHNWEAWSPWAKLDTAMKQTYAGSSIGAGSIYSWNGNKEVGEGRMTIMDSRPNESVSIKLEFLKPFKATNGTSFIFEPEGNKTTVTWSMYGENNFISKAFCLFMNMDKMVGKDFEKGLSQLKTVVESSPSGGIK